MATEMDASSSVTVEEAAPDFIEALLEWQDRILEPARARGERKDPFETGSGIPVAPLYTGADLTSHDPLRDEGKRMRAGSRTPASRLRSRMPAPARFRAAPR